MSVQTPFAHSKTLPEKPCESAAINCKHNYSKCYTVKHNVKINKIILTAVAACLKNHKQLHKNKLCQLQ